VTPEEVLDRALAGEYGPIRGNISRSLATALTALVAREKPALCLEIGMAFGIATLAILEGLGDDGRLISIDPFQTEHYAGFGRGLVARTDRADRHQVIEGPDFLALPRLIEDGVRVDFAYIDGMHTFDYVALDAFYVDKLLPVDGVVGFNDCGFRSIHKFLRFFRRHRDYEELDAGLTPDFRGRNPAVTLLRRLQGRSNQDRYFRKRRAWEPAHDFFRDF
jgi:hypothetical protein